MKRSRDIRKHSILNSPPPIYLLFQTIPNTLIFIYLNEALANNIEFI